MKNIVYITTFHGGTKTAKFGCDSIAMMNTMDGVLISTTTNNKDSDFRIPLNSHVNVMPACEYDSYPTIDEINEDWIKKEEEN